MRKNPDFEKEIRLLAAHRVLAGFLKQCQPIWSSRLAATIVNIYIYKLENPVLPIYIIKQDIRIAYSRPND